MCLRHAAAMRDMHDLARNCQAAFTPLVCGLRNGVGLCSSSAATDTGRETNRWFLMRFGDGYTVLAALVTFDLKR